MKNSIEVEKTYVDIEMEFTDKEIGDIINHYDKHCSEEEKRNLKVNWTVNDVLRRVMINDEDLYDMCLKKEIKMNEKEGRKEGIVMCTLEYLNDIIFTKQDNPFKIELIELYNENKFVCMRISSDELELIPNNEQIPFYLLNCTVPNIIQYKKIDITHYLQLLKDDMSSTKLCILSKAIDVILNS